MDIAVLGTGMVGQTIGYEARVCLGHEVKMGARGGRGTRLWAWVKAQEVPGV